MWLLYLMAFVLQTNSPKESRRCLHYLHFYFGVCVYVKNKEEERSLVLIGLMDMFIYIKRRAEICINNNVCT